MPEETSLMNRAKEKIKLSFNGSTKQSVLKKIMEIIDRCWVRQMDHPLYGAALYLNPGKPLIKSNDDATVGQLRGSFLDVLDRMVEDKDTRDKIHAQSLDFEALRGEAFSKKSAIENIESMSPLDWWRSYGGRAIELQRFARRIVGLCASSSDCERNWSTFEFIHTKKRNRLLHKRLNAIVFVSYNRKMKTRFQLRREKKGKGFDPLVIEQFDWDNEWADSSHVFPRGSRGCDIDETGLTWQTVDEALGASSSLRGRNLPRTANKRAKNSNPRLVEHELDSDSGNEEEEDQDPDPLDDADVTDCEDDDVPNGSNADGEDMEAAANVVDEFDDGY